jgi:hypothetical protein
MQGVATSSILSAAEIMFEPGDRFAISLSPEVSSTGQMPIPEGIQAAGLVIESVEDEQGRPLGAIVDAKTKRFIGNVPPKRRLSPRPVDNSICLLRPNRPAQPQI